MRMCSCEKWWGSLPWLLTSSLLWKTTYFWPPLYFAGMNPLGLGVCTHSCATPFVHGPKATSPGLVSSWNHREHLGVGRPNSISLHYSFCQPVFNSSVLMLSNTWTLWVIRNVKVLVDFEVSAEVSFFFFKKIHLCRERSDHHYHLIVGFHTLGWLARNAAVGRHHV